MTLFHFSCGQTELNNFVQALFPNIKKQKGFCEFRQPFSKFIISLCFLSRLDADLQWVKKHVEDCNAIEQVFVGVKLIKHLHISLS